MYWKCPGFFKGSDSEGQGSPYSMNSLFSEFFKKFGGVFLEVCETISGGGIWEIFGRKIDEIIPK